MQPDTLCHGRLAGAKFSKGGTSYINGNAYRSSGAFTVPQGLDRLRRELERLRVRDIIISTNVELNGYGDPQVAGASPRTPARLSTSS